MEKHDVRTLMSGLGGAGDYCDVMRLYGVWAVISPFNFPMALSGPSSGALLSRQLEWSSSRRTRALLGYKLYECYRDGRPRGVPSVSGESVVAEAPGSTPTSEDHLHRLVQRGMDIYKNFAVNVPKPVICEMGGKNPTIVTKNADLDKATDGVLRSAFGFGGQKCPRARAFVERGFTTTSWPS